MFAPVAASTDNDVTEDLLSLVPFVGTGAAIARLIARPLSQLAPSTPGIAVMDTTTQLINEASTGNVYALANGRRYWIPDPTAAFQNFGPAWTDRVNYTWSAADIAAVPLRPWSEFLSGGLITSSLPSVPTAYAAAGGFSPSPPSLVSASFAPWGSTPSSGPGTVAPTAGAPGAPTALNIPLLLAAGVVAWLLLK